MVNHSWVRDDALSDRSVMSVLETASGALWIGTGQNGIDILEPGRGVTGGHRPDPDAPGAARVEAMAEYGHRAREQRVGARRAPEGPRRQHHELARRRRRPARHRALDPAVGAAALLVGGDDRLGADRRRRFDRGSGQEWISGSGIGPAGAGIRP